MSNNMSHKEDNTDKTQVREASGNASAQIADDIEIVDAMKPSTASAASANKPLRYGTRKSRPGAKAPVITKAGSTSEALDEDDIEMDDLPIRANAPKHLIDSRNTPSEPRRDEEDRPRRERRPRGENRRRNDRERSPARNETAERYAEEESSPKSPAEATAQQEPAAENRPERFGVVNERERRARPSDQVQEFRPSRDGRTSENRSERREPVQPPKKKGLLSKILSFFTGGDSGEKAKAEAKPASSQQRRGDRGRPQGRFNDDKEGSEDGDRPRRRRSRNRNRKPRPEGEGDNRPRGEGQQRDDGNKRRRRRRPRRDGQGRREQQGVSSE